MIEVKKLSFSYGRRGHVLDEFDGCYSPGVHLFVGYSGCGKTTLLKLIGGLLSPSSGEILLDGAKIGGGRYLREKVGFVFQDLNLLPDASLRRNVKICASLNPNISKDSLNSRMTKFAEILGLKDLLDSKPATLSLGQQQRAAVLRAIILNPRILIMDEPTSSLDDLNAKVIARAIVDFVSSDGSKIVIIATHDERLKPIANEIHDFNQFLPLDRHLKAVAG